MSRSLEPCSLSAATRVSRTLCPPARPPHPRPSSSLGPAHPPIRPPHLRLLSRRLYDEDSPRGCSVIQWVGPAQVPDGLRRQETSFGASTLRQHSRGRLPSGHVASEPPPTWGPCFPHPEQRQPPEDWRTPPRGRAGARRVHLSQSPLFSGSRRPSFFRRSPQSRALVPRSYRSPAKRGPPGARLPHSRGSPGASPPRPAPGPPSAGRCAARR